MSKWTKCSERMPEMLGTYIVCGKMKYSFERKYEYFVDVAEYVPWDEPHGHPLGNKPHNSKFSTWNDWYEGQDEYEIIAWMEMPEPLIDEVKEADADGEEN